MSYDITELRQAVAATLQPLVDAGKLNTSSPYGLVNPQTPCAMVTVGPSKYDEGVQTDGLTFMVAVLVGTASEQEAQVTLDAFLGRGPDSVKALVEADAALNATVTAATGQRIYALDTASGTATPPVLGCEWTVEVLT